MSYGCDGTVRAGKPGRPDGPCAAAARWRLTAATSAGSVTAHACKQHLSELSLEVRVKSGTRPEASLISGCPARTFATSAACAPG